MAQTGKQPGQTMTLEALVAQLRQAHGDALRAVVLYGSAASGEDIAGKSDINVLLIADTLPLATLRALGQTMRGWQEAGNPPVLEMTAQEWQSSADIFPMEYADILERHKVLFGTLPLEGVVVQAADLRLQVEQEAMGKLLRLRRGVMVAGTDTERQQELLRASLSTLLVIFRAVMRLHGEQPPRDAGQVVSWIGARCGFAVESYDRVAALKRGTVLPAGETEGVLEGYVAGMTALVAYLNQYAG
ncbi:nucleotidyltransferase domain-containing protein [Gemmatimonas phototrophica]|uniref:nucleotidyltransferase domain-containing protein n=1 Tax=Gemmatimonas phototrophica TaxID=1379270 RepID=UPI0011AE23DD|nr:nucleotidyltransferase domain-containing protein [Gemmatimonas phototrophica]